MKTSQFVMSVIGQCEANGIPMENVLDLMGPETSARFALDVIDNLAYKLNAAEHAASDFGTRLDKTEVELERIKILRTQEMAAASEFRHALKVCINERQMVAMKYLISNYHISWIEMAERGNMEGVVHDLKDWGFDHPIALEYAAKIKEWYTEQWGSQLGNFIKEENDENQTDSQG